MIIHSPESEYAKERVKFEAQNSEMGPGQRPYVYREYPTAMYLAGIPAGLVGEPRIIECEPHCDETLAANLASRGWARTPLEALKNYETQKLEEAKLAAELEHEIVHKLTDKAVAEVRAAQSEHEGHLPTVPETPIRRRLAMAKRRNAPQEK